MGNCFTNQESQNEDESSPLVHGSTSRSRPADILISSIRSHSITATDDLYPCSYPTRSPINLNQPPIPKHDTSAFVYLVNHRDFVLPKPEYPVMELQNAFGNMYVRYDFALQVRIKVDEKLHEFKQILDVHPNLSMELCFQKWNSNINTPTYTISRTKTARKDVKSILLRAEDIPRNLWPAQKYIRELLDACHLFFEQYHFLQQVLNEWLVEIDKQLEVLDQTLSESSLRMVDRRYIREQAPRMKATYVCTLEWIEVFYNQIVVLIDEINAASTSLC